MFDIARMFRVEGGFEAVRKWPRRKYLKYRAYWVEHYRRDLMKRGIDPDPKKDEDDDTPRYWVEEDSSSPFKGSEFTDEIAHAPRD